MTQQTLSLEKYWKLFPATLTRGMTLLRNDRFIAQVLMMGPTKELKHWRKT